jgi:hypothetical protein
MKQRPVTMNREMNDILNKIRAGKSEGWFRAYAYYGIQKTQLLVDLPTFWGAYFKALDAHNYQHARNDAERVRIQKAAVQVANQQVKDTQASGMTGDIARIMRGGPFKKLWTAFHSYFSATYQLDVEAFKKTNFKDPTSIALLAADLALINTLPALYSMLMWELLRNECDWEPECLAKKLGAEQLQFILGLTMWSREAGTGVPALFGFDTYKYRGPAGISPLTAIYDFTQQAAQGDLDKALFRATMKAVGGITHLPLGQPTNTMEGMQAVWNGDVKGWDIPPAILAGPPR